MFGEPCSFHDEISEERSHNDKYSSPPDGIDVLILVSGEKRDSFEDEWVSNWAYHTSQQIKCHVSYKRSVMEGSTVIQNFRDYAKLTSSNPEIVLSSYVKVPIVLRVGASHSHHYSEGKQN